MEDFKQWSDSNNLIHLPTSGAEFTWANGRGGCRYTEKRLDRAIYNQSWLDLYHSIYVSTLIKHTSDHYPPLLHLKLSNTPFVSQFKFLRMWTLHPECESLVKDCWNGDFVGYPMYILTRKLKLLKEKLKSWNKETFGNVHDYVITPETKLQQIQSIIQLNGHSEALFEEERLAHMEFEEALNRQEAFWKEKANLKWHLEGDRNTKYFYRIAKIKTSSKTITSLQDGDIVHTEPEHISNHVVSYYKNLFCSNIVLQDPSLAAEVMPNLITDDINALKTVLPSLQEIKAAVFALNRDSSPGPAGFGAYFFHHF
jgi:hypothetical protein